MGVMKKKKKRIHQRIVSFQETLHPNKLYLIFELYSNNSSFYYLHGESYLICCFFSKPNINSNRNFKKSLLLCIMFNLFLNFRPFYGYHEGERDFLKISLCNPFLVTRLVSP